MTTTNHRNGAKEWTFTNQYGDSFKVSTFDGAKCVYVKAGALEPHVHGIKVEEYRDTDRKWADVTLYCDYGNDRSLVCSMHMDVWQARSLFTTVSHVDGCEPVAWDVNEVGDS